mmetsp:Transcript_18054/g.50537  ORF Transcript_18054/g.50537 Transcript_18054/m.50537 type:complete len:125 (+) Transcript_18054:1795-2169(+)
MSKAPALCRPCADGVTAGDAGGVTAGGVNPGAAGGVIPGAMVLWPPSKQCSFSVWNPNQILRTSGEGRPFLEYARIYGFSGTAVDVCAVLCVCVCVCVCVCNGCHPSLHRCPHAPSSLKQTMSA